MSANDSKRVALLARDGMARDRLLGVLHDIGASVVLESDPHTLEADALRAAAPQTVLIALEPAIEDALSRLDAVLEDPAITVIYDEAELTARRSGWEAQRWARHLGAKLHGHGDVLPPGHEEERSIDLQPGLPPTPAQLHADAGIEKHLEEAVDLAWELPQDDFAFSSSSAAATPTVPVINADDWLRAAAVEPVAEASRSGAIPPPLPGSGHEKAKAKASRELSLEPLDQKITAGPRAVGAVIAFAGIGGPDAVRKLLAALPSDFPRPLIVHLKLDGGRYDNLVRQMARVSSMPVELAEAGRPALPGHVYVLPGDVGLDATEGAVNFIAGGDLREGIRQLPPRDSSVLLLSGSDAHWVDVVWPLASKGAWIAGQSVEGCYDPSASHALAARGGHVASPADIAQRLVNQWS